MNVTDL